MGFIKDKTLGDYFKNILSSILGSIFLRGFNLVGGIIIARYLGSEIFGNFGFLKTIILSLSTIITFGLGYSINKTVSENSKRINILNSVISLSIKLTIILSFILIIIAPFWDKLTNDKLFNNEIVILLLSNTIFYMFNLVINGVISGFGKFKSIAKYNFLTGLVFFVTLLPLLFYFKLKGALLAFLVSQILFFILQFKEISEYLFFRNKFKSKLNLKFIIETIPLGIQEIISAVSAFLISSFIIKYSSYSDLANYNIVMQWTALVLFIPGVLRNIMLNYFSKSKSKSNKTRYLKESIYYSLILTTIPCVIVYFLFPIIITFYGEQYTNAIELLPFALLSIVFISLSNVLSQFFISSSENWNLTIGRIIRDLSLVFVLLYFINKLNMDAAISAVFSLFISSVIFFLYLFYFGLKIYKKLE